MKYSKDIVVYNKKGEIQYLTFKKLEQLNLKHAFFLRHGGISKNEYDSLNFRMLGKDSKENVLENLKRAGKAADFNFTKTVKGLQAHTDISFEITKENLEEYNIENENNNQIDALITKVKNIPLLITTADCTPIIVYDKEKNIVSNIHSGWKGTVKKIYLKTIEHMIQKYECKSSDLIVAIGPCIRDCCWTTKDRKFIEENLKGIWQENYISKIDDVYHVDFIKCIKSDLINLGILVENILDMNICTCCNTEDFFSFRKNTMLGIKEYGTQATMVELT